MIGATRNSVVCFASMIVVLVSGTTNRALALDPRLRLTQYTHQARGTEDGLPSASIMAIHQTRDGYLWPATPQGLVRYDGARFRYRLAGFDKTWINAGTRRVAYYTNIPPGEYELEVAAYEEDGMSTAASATLELTREPRLYQTGWFIAVCIGSVLLAVAGLHRFRIRWITAKAAVLKERNRVAREIHDTLGQHLVGIVRQLEVAGEALDESPEAARPHIARACVLAREGIEEARRSIWAIRPRLLDGSDLPTALTRLARQNGAGTGVVAEVSVRGRTVRMPEDIEANVLRIAQEAITNVVKHAHARTVHVGLDYRVGHFRLTIQDDGQGFDPSAGSDDAHLGSGLRGMRQRVEEMGGRWTLHSTPGVGTRIDATVPFPRSSKAPLEAFLDKLVSFGGGT